MTCRHRFTGWSTWADNGDGRDVRSKYCTRLGCGEIKYEYRPRNG